MMLVLAPAPAVQAEEIILSGCAEAGVEASCIVLKNGSRTYNISAATPKPRPGTYGSVTGTVSEDLSICQQGIVLSPAAWTADAGKTCP